MKVLSVVLAASLLIVGTAFSQEQYAVRLNENGLLKILNLAIKYNTGVNGSRTFTVPRRLYKFTLNKSQILSNPIVPIVNEISNLNLNRDLDFYLNTSDIKITGNVDSKSLKTSISNSSANGFDLKISINLPKVVVTANDLSLCEDKLRNRKQCGDGLKANINNLVLSTTGKALSVSVILRLKTDGNVAKVKVISVHSNLETPSSPHLDINFQSINIPKMAIVINGQETELDTSRLKSEVLKRKSFLAKKLLGFVADFIASDVAEMVNVYLVDKEMATSWHVAHDDEVAMGEFKGDLVFASPKPAYVLPVFKKQKNPIDQMMSLISDVVRNIQLDLKLKKISTPANKDVELSGLVDLVLNDKRMSVRDTLGNSSRSLPKLDMSSLRQNDVTIALSEPMINGALDLTSSTGLFQKLFAEFANVQGFSIKNVKLHFASNNAIDVVVNAQLNLKEISSNGQVGKWFKNKIAAWLERNNNKSVIYFPIQVRVYPLVKKVASGVALDLKVMSPFANENLINDYNYPSNVGDMTDMVRDGVMDELEQSLGEFTNKTYAVDLSKFLNQAGVEFMPKAISINQSAYLLMSVDINDIRFNSSNPLRK